MPKSKKAIIDDYLNKLLSYAIDHKASDIHLSAGEKPLLRLHWDIIEACITSDSLKESDMETIAKELAWWEEAFKKFITDKEFDISYESKFWINFRVNLFFKRKKIAAALRRIENEVTFYKEIGIPWAFIDLLNKKQGLILVCGPTWSGKSTSLQAMLEHINENRIEHILTIEDPIEYIYTNNKSFFSQREIKQDTHNFTAALRSALREDPDIIMVWELRDAETINSALHLAETWHLVLSTLHTSSAMHTVSRMVSSYKADEQDSARSRLADCLLWVLSQRLIPRIDQEWRVAIFEVMLANSAVKNLIRSWDDHHINNSILTWRNEWMILMKDYANFLENEWIIKESDYIWFFTN